MDSVVWAEVLKETVAELVSGKPTVSLSCPKIWDSAIAKETISGLPQSKVIVYIMSKKKKRQDKQ